ncbi:MAG: ATP-binding cassette domain-containing protein [Planctomycetota bacterium]
MITLENVSIRYRGPALLDDISVRIEPGDRIGLTGRNGAGKSTLMRLIVGDENPDHGTIILASGITVARLVQDVPSNPGRSVSDVVTEMATGIASQRESWAVERSVVSTLTRMDLQPDAAFDALSSGWRRRVLLAGAIAAQPDVLLLDEPTNHLDIGMIQWLESYLKAWRGTLLFVTHDRAFLQNLATRIWEIDRGRMFDWACDHATFLKRKEQAFAAEEKQNALFDKKLAQEEAWIRQGIKARRTRNEGRVRALKTMREEFRERRKPERRAKLNLETADRSGRLVAKLDGVSFSYGNETLIRGFGTTILRGDRVGLIGPNGAGKTTLLKLILGQLQPTTGTVRLGTNLQIAYFDQLRSTLDEDRTVADNVADGADRVEVGGKSKHIYGYLQDFLFTPERSRTPVKYLSGGERNRLLMARLMTKPANVLVLDEPTNDLDGETLELLEEQLSGFDGTILMVSHDRAFINNVVTSTLVFEAADELGASTHDVAYAVREYVGGYDEWQAAVNRREADAAMPAERKVTKSTPKPSAPTRPSKKKLSYKDQRELDGLPSKIEKLESEIATIHERMGDPSFYQSDSETIAKCSHEAECLQRELETAYQRWEELEAMQDAGT